ncbi:tricin synthase 1-like [Phalaenopsis equestris]|uniref:tricin synthase 1-like n=1 Tax=Phalaenopsis equestris TaxID=78828 RepID=UPI0009E4DA9D|nr:tricin synthase 1-like [Phalaenopsis equestris]
MAIVFLACSPLTPFSLKPLTQLFPLRFPSEKISRSSLSPFTPPLTRASCYTDAVKPVVAAPLVKLDSEKYGKKQVISLSPQLYEYVLANVREPQVLRELRQETAGMRGSQMQVSPDQAQLLAILVEILGAVKCIEIGVYTGYSSLAIALALPDSGYLVACERDANCLEIAKKYYERAGVSDKVKIKHSLAVDTLEQLIQNGECCR